MKRFLLTAALLMPLLASPVLAKNFAIPAEDPALTIALPDTWKLTKIDYGYSAVSSDKNVFFSVENAPSKDLKAMMSLNESWLKENNIKLESKPEETQEEFNGLKADLMLFSGTDDDGPTRVTFGLIDAGKGRLVMLTLWGSAEDRKAHAEDLGKILSSIKPIE